MSLTLYLVSKQFISDYKKSPANNPLYPLELHWMYHMAVSMYICTAECISDHTLTSRMLHIAAGIHRKKNTFPCFSVGV